MAEETTSTATEQVETATEPHGDETEARDWKAEYEKLLEQSRKWEARSKSNAEKARAYDEAAKAAADADGKLGDLADRAEKAEAELAAMRAERERAATVADVAKGANVPAELLSLMRGDTAEELQAAADALSGYVRSLSLYPEVPDGGAKRAPAVTKESISGIEDRAERMRARAENANLYR